MAKGDKEMNRPMVREYRYREVATPQGPRYISAAIIDGIHGPVYRVSGPDSFVGRIDSKRQMCQDYWAGNSDLDNPKAAVKAVFDRDYTHESLAGLSWR